MMFKSLALSTVLSAVASIACADGYAENSTAVVVNVEPQYVIVYTPTAQEQCVQVQVPVYGQTGYNQGNVFAGAIVGGLIGNQFGNGTGNDIATVLGAIVGANQASQPRVGVVYTTQVQCSVVTVNVETRKFDNYLVTYRMNGMLYTIQSNRLFEVGQRITVN